MFLNEIFYLILIGLFAFATNDNLFLNEQFYKTLSSALFSHFVECTYTFNNNFKRFTILYV